MAKNKHLKDEQTKFVQLEEENKTLREENDLLKSKIKYPLKYGMICIIDALGTKGVWRQDNPSIYIGKLHKIKEEIEKFIRDNTPDADIKIMIHSFSDTFFISAQTEKEQTDEGEWEKSIRVFLPWFSRMITHFFSISLLNNIFFRGAFSCGKFYRDNDFVIGPAIDDAYFYFESFNMFGIICTPNTTHLIDYTLEFLKSRNISHEANAFIKYKVLLKKDRLNSEKNAIELYCLDWPKYIFDILEKSEKELEKNIAFTMNPFLFLSMYFGEYPIPANAYEKYQETIDFYHFCTKVSSESK